LCSYPALKKQCLLERLPPLKVERTKRLMGMIRNWWLEPPYRWRLAGQETAGRCWLLPQSMIGQGAYDVDDGCH
jgi:hypothetical protein